MPGEVEDVRDLREQWSLVTGGRFSWWGMLNTGKLTSLLQGTTGGSPCNCLVHQRPSVVQKLHVKREKNIRQFLKKLSIEVP